MALQRKDTDVRFRGLNGKFGQSWISAAGPTETCAPQDCCDAERVNIKKDYGGKFVRNANGAALLPSIRSLIA